MEDRRRDQVAAARNAAFEEAAREEDVRKLNTVRIQIQLEKFRAEEEREMADTELERLEEEDRIAQDDLLALQQIIIDRTAASNKRKREEEQTRHRADGAARLEEAAEQEERERAAAEDELKRNGTVIADISRRSKEAEKKRSVAYQKVEGKARALQRVEEQKREAAALPEKASRERDTIDLGRIAAGEAEVMQSDAVHMLCLNVARVVDAATFFVETPEAYEDAGRRLYYLLGGVKSGEMGKLSDEFATLLGQLVDHFGEFLGLVEEENANTYTSSSADMVTDGLYHLKVDIVRLLLQILHMGVLRARFSDEVFTMVNKPLSSRINDEKYREKRPTNDDVTLLNSYAITLREFADMYVLLSEKVISAQKDSIVQQRLALKERQAKRGIGFEYARLNAMARRFLTPPHAKDRPNYVPVSIMVMGRPKGKANRVVLDAYKTMADKVIGVFDRKQSRERNYGYVIHLGRQARVRVLHLRGAYTGPIETASYSILIFIDRAVIGALFTVSSGILRPPDDDEASPFRHAEARLALTKENDVSEFGKGVYEVFLKLSGKPTGDGRLPIKSMLFHRWSIALPDEEEIHKIATEEIALNDLEEPDEVGSWDGVKIDDSDSDDDA